MEPIDERRPGGAPATASGPGKAAGDDLSAEWAMPFMPADDAPAFGAEVERQIPVSHVIVHILSE